MAVVALRVPGANPMPHVNRPEVPDDYSSYPSFVDDTGQKWAHINPQAFEPPERMIPVYDAISADEASTDDS